MRENKLIKYIKQDKYSDCKTWMQYEQHIGQLTIILIADCDLHKIKEAIETVEKNKSTIDETLNEYKLLIEFLIIKELGSIKDYFRGIVRQ
jgi:hypothetical protein